MRTTEAHLRELCDEGFTVVEGFLGADELRDAQEALWSEFPRPEEYHADPSAHPRFGRSQFAGLRVGPWKSWNLNRLAFHPDLVDLAQRFLGSADLRLYKTELWAKYSGAIDYDQTLHRDFGNHTIVVPSRKAPMKQMTSFILLSDVSAEDGPTKLVPVNAGPHVPYWPLHQPPGALEDVEVSVTGPAGTLFTYRTDVLHRGSAMMGERRARFVLLADYEVWGNRWTGKVAWPDRALSAGWTEMVERASPRERELFGFPAIGDPYWDDQTITDTNARYPRMDMQPYRASALQPRSS